MPNGKSEPTSRPFQHAAARRRLIRERNLPVSVINVSTRSRPKAADKLRNRINADRIVSTRSRPKAAEQFKFWRKFVKKFQHAAARRRLSFENDYQEIRRQVSTRSRPKAAEKILQSRNAGFVVSTRSRPKAADNGQASAALRWVVSTRSRPKAAELLYGLSSFLSNVSTRSRPKAADSNDWRRRLFRTFQHAAARRRLKIKVFHSFTIQRFQHAAARRRLNAHATQVLKKAMFQHAAARRRLSVKCASGSLFGIVSTRSRPKAADGNRKTIRDELDVSTRSRPKAADN